MVKPVGRRLIWPVLLLAGGVGAVLSLRNACGASQGVQEDAPKTSDFQGTSEAHTSNGRKSRIRPFSPIEPPILGKPPNLPKPISPAELISRIKEALTSPSPSMEGAAPGDYSASEETSPGDYSASLIEASGSKTIGLDEARLEPPPNEPAYDPETGYRCRIVKVGDQVIGYIRFWLASESIEDILNGNMPNSLQELFPTPSSLKNVYFDILDSATNLPVGKNNRVWYQSDRFQPMYIFVWNDGREEFYVENYGFLFLADSQGNLKNPNPMWGIRYQRENDLERYSSGIDIFPANDPTAAGFSLDMLENSPYLHIRLQDSCSENAKMLPTFLEVGADAFGRFVRLVFG